MAKGRESMNKSVKMVQPIQPKMPTDNGALKTIKSAKNANGHSVGTVQELKPLYPTKARVASVKSAKTVASTTETVVQALEPLSPTTKPEMLLLNRVKSTSISSTTKIASKGGVSAKQRKSSIDNCSGRVDIVWNEMPIESLISTTPSTLSMERSLTMEERYLEAELEQELMEHHPDGCISRLREERRDLYDLLYGDEDKEKRLDDFDPYGFDN